MDYLPMIICKQRSVALIVHDQKKREPIRWCGEHRDILSEHFFCGTDTTARTITDVTNPPVKGHNNDPLDGGQQIGAKIVEEKIDFVISFFDPLTAQPHDSDVKVLLRVAQVHDISTTNNKASADFMITSPLMGEKCGHDVVNFRQNIIDRTSTLQEQDM